MKARAFQGFCSSSTGLLFALLLLAGCSNKEEVMTPTTPTMRFTYNGHATSTIPTDDFTNATFSPLDSVLGIGGLTGTDDSLYLVLHLHHFRGVGVYPLPLQATAEAQSSAAVYLKREDGRTGMFSTLENNKGGFGNITISEFDLVEQRLSGTFTFTALAVPSSGAKGSAVVTEGHFLINHFY